MGGGIAGLTTALSVLVDAPEPIDVTVLEASDRVGGLIRTSKFAGLDVDEAADAFLTRVPWASQLASELGLGAALTSPTGAPAAVWHDGMHEIPGDLLLGVPAKMRSFATSDLFSPLGKARAALEPFLPRTRDNDSIGEYVRRRFGNQVLERLVDPLVGSIYAADTDTFSLEAVPQIHALVGERSMLLAAAKARRAAARNAKPGDTVFGAPLKGMGALVDTLTQRVEALGGRVHVGARVETIVGAGARYSVNTLNAVYACDAVVVASPARHSAAFVHGIDPHAAELLSTWDHASVVLITLAVPAVDWPAHLTGSGYLVPKPDQRWVTAASFGSNKWAKWRPADGSMIVRVSLGRDGLDVMEHSDERLLDMALADMKMHLGFDIVPSEVRISRWAESFPQYRPHHFRKLDMVERSLAASAPGVFFAGASYRGIGIPACVQQARTAAGNALENLFRQRN